MPPPANACPALAPAAAPAPAAEPAEAGRLDGTCGEAKVWGDGGVTCIIKLWVLL